MKGIFYMLNNLPVISEDVLKLTVKEFIMGDDFDNLPKVFEELNNSNKVLGEFLAKTHHVNTISGMSDNNKLICVLIMYRVLKLIDTQIADNKDKTQDLIRFIAHKYSNTINSANNDTININNLNDTLVEALTELSGILVK
jgi:hypothetical protein